MTLHQAGDLKIEVLPWDDFTGLWLPQHWQQGQHAAVMGLTGMGKTTLVGGMLQTRRWVGVLGIKGIDETLKGLLSKGFVVSSRWPLTSDQRKKVRDGEPMRVIFTVPGRTAAAKAARRALCLKAMRGMSEQGHWCIACPDLALLTWKAFGNLNEAITEALIEARAAGVSVVTDLQDLTRIAHYAHSQATVLAAGPFPDRDTRSEVGRIMGRSRAEMRGLLGALAEEEPPGTPRRMWIVATRSPSVPLVLVRPPFLG